MAKVYLGICFVGNVGRSWRPRPIEFAFVRDDGTALSTLINPESDLYEARAEFDLGVIDIIGAPRLAEAWPALSCWLVGHTPVGVDLDQAMGWLAFELKRNGAPTDLPNGITISAEQLNRLEKKQMKARKALDRAFAVKSISERLAASGPYLGRFKQVGSDGFLLPRVVPTKKVSESIDRNWVKVATKPRDLVWSVVDPTEVLRVGVRVCFTGSLFDSKGEVITKEAMELAAEIQGLVPVESVTRYGCDVLIVAEVGTQSRKAKDAIECGIPVVKSTDFWDWCVARAAGDD